MTNPRQILALDLAAKTGWALGTLRDNAPLSGSIQIANDSASMAKLFSCWRLYLRDFLALNPEIGVVVFEAPLLPYMKSGQTTINTLRRLIGLCAVTEELLFTLGTYDVREARVSDVRSHFIGSNRHKRPEAKAMTIAQCRRLGWKPVDDNAADALALWDYQRSLLINHDLLSRT